MDDMVNSPSHYQLDGLEAIDIIKASLTADEYLGYLKGNALKYMLREPLRVTQSRMLLRLSGI